MAGTGAAPRILVVDDDEGLLILMAETLRAEGYVVDTAESGAAALAWLADHPPPDLMLLDLKLRDVGGATLVQRLPRAAARVPFLVVTGQGDEKVAVEVMKQGALDYVMKNSAMLDLLPEVLRRALNAIEQERALAQAQASLRESLDRFGAAMQATNDGVWDWQLPENRVYFSDRWKAMLGYAPEEIADDYGEWIDRVHPEDRGRLAKAQESCFASDAGSFSIEYRLRHRDGGYRWILCRAVLTRDEQGRPQRLTGAHTDVTANKQLEEEILAISDREQRRIGQDLHDGLGQQLTAIELMVHTIKGDLEADRPEVAAQLGRLGGFLREAITQTRSLAHGLTAFMVNATGLANALADLAQRTAAMGRVTCRFEHPAAVQLEDATVAGHLYRIAQEAVGNALRHAGASEIVIALRGTGSGILLQIGDNGRGLPARRSPGPGIGLQVMEHRANAIGAELALKSDATGTTVTCTLNRTP